MTVFSYRTIENPSEGMYKERGSKFLAFAYPVTSAQEIKEHIEFLKKKYFDARHHCFAWVLGADKKYFRSFDDGEPNHSAGDPILGQIRSKNLTNVLVVVVRYFGGVKLGVGGLINAYKTAADDALSNVTIVEREVYEPFTLTYDYSSTPEIMRLVKEFDLKIINQRFEELCTIDFNVTLRSKEKFLEKIDLLRIMKTDVQLTIYAQTEG